MVTINLIPASDYLRESYGIILQSETEHDFTGPNIHNRHHAHVLQVWDNAKRTVTDPDILDGRVHYVDPKGQSTTERYSYLWSAQANVISAHPGERTPQGDTLRIGDIVTLVVHGLEVGDFSVEARRLHNPHMTKL